MIPETILDNLVFPECPRWRHGELYFSDQHDSRVWVLDQTGKARLLAEVPGHPSGLGWLPDGSLLIVSMRERRVLRQDLSVYADLSRLAAGYLNDMVVDRDGRAYVGNFGFDLDGGETPKPTALAKIENGAASIAAADLWFPNGAVIAPGGKMLIVAETFAARLTAFALDQGILSNRRVFAELPGLFPDGICLDEEGAVWVACAGNKKVVRVMEGGKITHQIPLQERSAYACMLGGDDRRDLYLCTARDHRPQRTVPLRSGRIERARVDVPGAGLP